MAVLKPIYRMLTPRERFQGIGLVALMVVSMMLEMLGIGIVVPALSAMSSGLSGLSSPATQQWLAYLGNPSQNQIILGGLAVLLAIYVIKVAFLVFANWRQAAFVSRVHSRVAMQLFRRYLLQPWRYHLANNSTDLVQKLGETTGLSSVCTAFLSLVAESLVLAGILSLLLWYEPVGAIAVGILMGGATWLLQSATQHRLQQWGTRYWRHVANANRVFAEGLQGAKDVKVLGREQSLIDRAAVHKSEQARLNARNTVFQQLPRLWFELIAVGGLCALTAVMVREGKSPQAMVPTLGLFAAAAFRMLPSANRVITGLQTLRFSSAVMNALYSDLQLPEIGLPDRCAPLPFRQAIRLEGIRFRYDKTPLYALDGVSMKIPHGASVGLIGGSGAGKSTLVDILLGLLAPTSGRVTVDGADIADNVRAWQSVVGYVPQSIFLSDDTIRANVAFGVPPDQIDDIAVARAIAAAQLDSVVSQLPDGTNTVLGERGMRLSGGQRQRIGVARALYHDPQVLVLDEATSALDSETESGVMAAVESLHGAKTLIIIAHRLTTVARCDVVYRLEKGKVVATGSLAEVTS